jgi:uncharacterized protein (DUF2237 family)
MSKQLNVLGTELQACCFKPLTGYYRDGYCHTGPQDKGSHTVCAIVTDAFLEYSKSMGNDLITPVPAYNFLGLKPGDKWCLCALRWLEAEKAGKAPHVVLEACHQNTLSIIKLNVLKEYAVAENQL